MIMTSMRRTMQFSNHDSSIYITVMSDSSLERYPSNTASRFKVDLAEPIILEGSWQIALTEIHISNNWYDITEDCSLNVEFECIEKLKFKSTNTTPKLEQDDHVKQEESDESDSSSSDDDVDDESNEDSVHQFTVNFKCNSFPSISYFCMYLSHEIFIQMPPECKEAAYQYYDPAKPVIEFQIDPLMGNAKIIKIQDLNVSINFNKFTDIFSILALDLSNHTNYDLPIEGERRASLTIGNIGLLVLCNLVHFQNVGDSQMRLLRLISIKGCDKREDRHSHYFQKPYYISTCLTSFQTIDIELIKDNNRSVTVPPGSRIIAVLHLQRKLTI